MADAIVVNADVRTCDPAKPRAEAFAIKNGKFMAVGSTEFIESLGGARRIDLRGATVLPGIIDAHTHLVFGVELAMGVDLFEVAHKSAWLAAIAKTAKTLPANSWLFGGRWDLTILKGETQELPSLEDVDAATGDVPMVLRDIDFHSLWLNSAAMRAIGVDKHTAAPEGGEIVRDSKGNLTGEFKETATSMVEDHAAFRAAHRLTPAGLRNVFAHFNSVGITAVHDMCPDFDLWEEVLAENEPIPLRLWFGLMLLSPDQRQQADFPWLYTQKKAELSALAKRNGHSFEFGYIKFMVDGTLANYTAALEEAYSDRCVDHFRGEPITQQDELSRLVAAANTAGFPVSVHAIGDRGVKMALSAFEASPTKPEFPNRIEHIESIKPEDLPRFSAAGVVASVQPNHAIAGEYQEARLGPERLPLSYAWQTLLSSGARVVLGSDWPTALETPVSQLNSAVLRRKRGRAWYVQNALSFDEALYAYTQAPADMCGWGSDIGSISARKSADFVVLPAQLTDLDAQKFEEWHVAETWIGGKCVYSK